MDRKIDFDRHVDRYVNLGVVNQHVIAAKRIGRVHAERIIVGDMHRIDVAELAVVARQAISPVPLLANGFDFVRLLRHVNEITPNEETGRQHGSNTDRGQDRQPGFKLLVFRIIGRPSTFLCTIFDYWRRP